MVKYAATILVILGAGVAFFIAKQGAQEENPRVSQNKDYYMNRDQVLDEFPIDSNSIVFAGDSHFQNFELAELLENPHVKNRGINGDDVRGLSKRIVSYLDNSPKAIILLIGVNDLGNGRSPEDVMKDYERLTALINSKAPNTMLFCLNIPPAESPNGYYKDINKQIVKFNELLCDHCAANRIGHINIYDSLVSKGVLAPKYSADGLHLSGEGYLIVAEALKKAITFL